MQNCWHWRPERGVNGTLWDGMYRFNKKLCENLIITKLKMKRTLLSLLKKLRMSLKFGELET